MKTEEKKRILTLTVIIGIICIVLVMITAYSAELRCENNDMIKLNESLQGEIDNLNIKIKSANNIENIEKVAINKLGMVYPNKDECIYVTNKDTPDENFAMVIKEQAYN